MISLSSYKELLGQAGQHLTDDELEVSKQVLYQFAEIAFLLWAQEKTSNQGQDEFTNKT